VVRTDPSGSILELSRSEPLLFLASSGVRGNEYTSKHIIAGRVVCCALRFVTKQSTQLDLTKLKLKTPWSESASELY
jgi:hypothetical protein